MEQIINIELTSYCNRKCIVCPQGNTPCKIKHKHMTMKTFDLFLKRIKKFYEQGNKIKEIINSGYGESILHPKLKEIFEKYQKLKKELYKKYKHYPKISIVTNGSFTNKENLNKILPAVDIVKFSFPTSNPENYGYIMLRNKSKGKEIITQTIQNLKTCMQYAKQKRIKQLRIHISPPHKLTYKDFDKTIQFLTKLANQQRLNHLNIVIFPTTSDRAGLINSKKDFVNSFYKKQIKKYKNKILNNIKLNFLSELKVFYPTPFKLIKTFFYKFPCIWKSGSLSINSSGNYRFCINDAENNQLIGTLKNISIKQATNYLKKSNLSKNCINCNENPLNKSKLKEQEFYNKLVKLRKKLY